MFGKVSKSLLTAILLVASGGASAQDVASGIIKFSPTEPYPVHEVYYPGTEALAEDEMRVIACGTGMPQPRLKQAAACFAESEKIEVPVETGYQLAAAIQIARENNEDIILVNISAHKRAQEHVPTHAEPTQNFS